MSRTPRVAYLPVLLTAVLAATSTASAQWTVTSLHPAGAVGSYAIGVSGSQQLGVVYLPVGELVAALWHGSAESYVNLIPPSGASLFGVSDGRQVGHVSYQYEVHAAVWAGTSDSWVDLNPAGIVASEAFCISGTRVGGYVRFLRFRGPDHAALWDLDSPTTWIDLHPLDVVSIYSYVNGISDSQQVGMVNILISEGTQVTHAAMWTGTAESYVDLNPTGAHSSEATGVSDGQQVGRATLGDRSHAVLWNGSAGSCVDLSPTGSYGRANAVHQGIQVGSVDDHATIWFGSAESRVDLHTFIPDRFAASDATAVWADATRIYVVGYGQHTPSDYQREAFMWTLLRCPSGVDLGRRGGLAGFDGLLDNNDLIVFIDYFFAADAHADRGSAGGVPGADGLFDNNDFVVYIDQLFAGC